MRTDGLVPQSHSAQCEPDGVVQQFLAANAIIDRGLLRQMHQGQPGAYVMRKPRPVAFLDRTSYRIATGDCCVQTRFHTRAEAFESTAIKHARKRTIFEEAFEHEAMPCFPANWPP